MAVADFRRAEVIGEVWQPDEGAFIVTDSLHQPVRCADPVEGGHQDKGEAVQDGHQEAGDQAHIVIKRQPAHQYVLICDMQDIRIGGDLVQHRLVGKSDAFLQSGGT